MILTCKIVLRQGLVFIINNNNSYNIIYIDLQLSIGDNHRRQCQQFNREFGVYKLREI